MVNYNKIKALAKDKGLSQKFICDKIGKRRGYFSECALGNGAITPENLEIIADTLDTTVEYLCDETENKEKPTKIGELSQEDLILLDLIRKMTDAQRKELMDALKIYPDSES